MFDSRSLTMLITAAETAGVGSDKLWTCIALTLDLVSCVAGSQENVCNNRSLFCDHIEVSIETC
jgi:hypothetical protein